jgi:predicted GNAT family N-acyltransferase
LLAATHVAALLAGRVIATLRRVAHGQTVKIGRMAVAAASRKTGIERTLMEFAEAWAVDRGFEKIVLGAQLTACDFYRRLGCVEEGPVFDAAGLPHVIMSKSCARDDCRMVHSMLSHQMLPHAPFPTTRG